MTAGRLRYLPAGAKGPKTPAFRLRFEGGGELVLTEAGSKKRAGVWLLTPEPAEAELAHLGPEALGLGAERLRRDPRRRLAAAALAAARPARARRHRPRAGERDPQRAQLSPFALSPSSTTRKVERLATAIDERARPRARAARARRKGDKDVYRVHGRLGEPCPRCGTPIAAVDYEEHTIFYCPACQTGGQGAEGPAAVAPAAVGNAEARRSLVLLAVALVLSMSTWFSASAALPQLREEWSIGNTASAWLTIAVQLGFVAGALFSSVVNLADVRSARLVIVGGSLGAAAANLGLLRGLTAPPLRSRFGSSPAPASPACTRPR